MVKQKIKLIVKTFTNMGADTHEFKTNDEAIEYVKSYIREWFRINHKPKFDYSMLGMCLYWLEQNNIAEAIRMFNENQDDCLTKEHVVLYAGMGDAIECNEEPGDDETDEEE
jgi:hypothetical protein